MGLAIFLESPLLKVAKKQLDRLKEQQEKVTASSVQMTKAAFKANAAQGLKSRGDTSKKESKVTFTDLAQELPHQDSEVGPSVQPQEATTTLPADGMPHLNKGKQEEQRKPPPGLPPALKKPPTGMPPA